jgi:eukaryotic-like serine/threonine-protein kinase
MTKYLILACLLCASACKNDAPSKPAAHAMFRDNPSRNPAYEDDSVHSISHVKWTFTTGGIVRGTPAVSGGQVYIGSGDSIFYALNETDGKVTWTFKANSGIHSTAAVCGDTVFFTSRNNTVYALNTASGALLWKSDLGPTLPYDWSFDFYVSSPVIYNNTLYTGSGSGFVYALDASTGKERWKFPTGAIVRSSPSVANGLLYVGDFSGKLYALDLITGKKSWVYTIKGANDNNLAYGFDRRAIVASPVIKDDYLVFGARDGYLYCLDALSGKERWTRDYKFSWVIGSVNIKDSLILCSTSSSHYIDVLSLQTGVQRWQVNTGYAFSSPFITGNTAVGNDVPGEMYFMDFLTGRELSRYRITNANVFSSPVLSNGVIFIGSDDQQLYALQTSAKQNNPTLAGRRAVYWVKTPFAQVDQDALGNSAKGLDLSIRDYFVDQGYKVLDDTSLRSFFERAIADSLPSVVVFATNYFPATVYDTVNRNNLLVRYLHTGGKIVATGLNPAGCIVDKKGNWAGYDFPLAGKILDIGYTENDSRPFSNYPTIITPAGARWGLRSSSVSYNGIDPAIVSVVLATNEYGKASCWVKTYAPREGSGFVQLCLLPATGEKLLPDVQRAAEYGLSGG